MRKYLILIVIIFSIISIFLGCSNKNKVVVKKENQPPIVYLPNIPTEDTKFSINPRIYWYGVDPDGFITRYQWAVIPELVQRMDSTTGRLVDPETLGFIPKEDGLIKLEFVKTIEDIHPDEWVDTLISKHLKSAGFEVPETNLFVFDTNLTEYNVRMFAQLETLKYISQYIFIRAVDNLGATSKILKSPEEGGNTYRRFIRNNHPPKSHIKFDNRYIYYCLPETTKTWKGIQMVWEGSDSSDYPRKQPDFLYKWEFLGPFKDTINVDPLNVDTALVEFSYDSLRGTRWVSEKSKVFVDLKNYDQKPVGGGKTGWYLFRVNSKDDALTEGKAPATVFFRVVNPYFSYNDQKRILLIDASSYLPSPPTPPKEEGVKSFYKGILEELNDELGYTFDFWIDSTTLSREKHLPPNEDLLSLYDLVIAVNYAKLEGLSGGGARRPQGGMAPPDTGYMQYRRYLDIGGKVWFIGVDNFGLDYLAGNKGINSTLPTRLRPSGFLSHRIGGELAYYYFGITAVYFAYWATDPIEQSHEFIAAVPYVPNPDFPRLEVDSETVANQIWADFLPFVQNLPQAVPGVNYETIGPRNERLYTFVSYRGDVSPMHGKPCATRLVGSTFKTAEFCFPLFAIKKEEAKKVFESMIQWFFEG